jgi:hypothetical protein
LPGTRDEHMGQKYICSNPNCKCVFSKPKVIKYHVCPVCQTLVNTADVANQEEIELALATQNLLKRRKPKVAKRDNPEKLSETAIQAPTSQPKAEELCEPEKEPEIVEQVAAARQTPVPTQNPVVLAPMQPVVAIETIAVTTTSSGCQYGFGYLRQREKGKGIPDTCIECSKSLDCMLSEYYKKEESVKEIKKWYSL